MYEVHKVNSYDVAKNKQKNMIMLLSLSSDIWLEFVPVFTYCMQSQRQYICSVFDYAYIQWCTYHMFNPYFTIFSPSGGLPA